MSIQYYSNDSIFFQDSSGQYLVFFSRLVYLADTQHDGGTSSTSRTAIGVGEEGEKKVSTLSTNKMRICGSVAVGHKEAIR